MAGYDGDDSATVAAWKDLWFHTGDSGYFDAEGNLFFTGRVKDAMRVRGFPFAQEVKEFVMSHPGTFIIEQNRDAQLKTMLVTEEQINVDRLISVLHYDGTPITARFIAKAIGDHQDQLKVTPLRKVVS